MAKKNTYDVSRDIVMARPMVKAYDASTGAEVSVGAEGSFGVAVCVRRMDSEDGTQGQPRISLNTAYVAKKASSRLAWIVGGDRPELRTPQEGDLVLGSALKRLDPRIAAAVFPEFGRYAEKVASLLAKRAA